MFCSKCGKTLKPGVEVCSCGQVVGAGRFEGVPYTSAQPRIAPEADAAQDALPYTRTTYTGKDEQMQADADDDARTTYRPVYEGASVPEEIRGDVRRAVGGEEEEDAQPARPMEEDPLVREMFDEGEGGGIDDFDLEDAFGRQEEHLCSADLREWMAANHLDLTIGVSAGHFSPRDAFGSHSDSDHVYNTPRAWAIQRALNPHAGPWDTAAPAADFGPESDAIPWCREPERKLTIEDVKYVLSLHYQGTPYDPYAGGERAGLYRPIGINRNSQLAVLQLRPHVAPERAALQWIAYGSNAFNALVPLYANVDETPAYLEDTTTRVTSENFYWANRIVGALADAAYGSCLPHVERYQQALTSRCAALVRACDAEGGDLVACNQAIADECRQQTEALLDKVLFEASMRMRNGFSRSDS